MSSSRDAPYLSSTLSSESTGSSYSSSNERSSYPATARSDVSQNHRRNVHSAPAALSPAVNLSSQPLNLTSGSNTFAALNPSNATLNDPPGSMGKPTFRDQFEKDEASRSNLKHRLESTTAPELEENEPKTKRSCTGNLNLDWSYSNVYTSGSQHGRKTIGTGSGAPGACSLM